MQTQCDLVTVTIHDSWTMRRTRRGVPQGTSPRWTEGMDTFLHERDGLRHSASEPEECKRVV
jgi:hypothetical protein